MTNLSWTWLSYTLSVFGGTKSRLLTTLKKEPFEKIVGKGENAGDQHF